MCFLYLLQELWIYILCYLFSGSQCGLVVDIYSTPKFMDDMVICRFWPSLKPELSNEEFLEKDLQVNTYLGNQYIILRPSLVQCTLQIWAI